MQNVKVRDAITGRPLQGEPLAGMSKESSKVEDESVRLTRFARDIATGRLLLKADGVYAPDGARVVKMDAGGIGLPDVNLPRTSAFFSANQSPDFIAPIAAARQAVASQDFYTLQRPVDQEVNAVLPIIVDPSGRLPELPLRLSNTRLTCLTRGVAIPVGTQVDSAFDGGDLPLEATAWGMRAVLGDWERRTATLATASASYDPSCVSTLGATAKWNAGSTRDILGDIFARFAASALPISSAQSAAMVVPEQIAQYLFKDADVSNAVRAGWVPPRILIAAAKIGAAAYAWGSSNVAFLRLGNGAPGDTPSLKTFTWDGFAPGGRASGGILVRRAFLADRGSSGTEWITVVVSDVVAVVDGPTKVGGLIVGAKQ